MSLGPEWFVVEQRGFDSSGRPLRNTKYMWAMWDALRERPRVKPFAWKLVMVQGAFMSWAGGGASASDGFHNLAGCNDIRTWNLTDTEISILIWESRQIALGAWRRDTSWRHGGMAEHCHWGQGGDRPLSPGAAISWSSYVNVGDGLAGSGGDYERRPSPMILTPPAYIFQEELTMDAEVRQAFLNVHDHITRIRVGLEGDIDTLANAESARAIADRRRDRAAAEKAKTVAARVIAKLGNVQDAVAEVDSKLASGDIAGARERLALLAKTTNSDLKDDPDVDGVDNPAERNA